MAYLPDDKPEHENRAGVDMQTYIKQVSYSHNKEREGRRRIKKKRKEKIKKREMIETKNSSRAKCTFWDMGNNSRARLRHDLIS